MSNRKDFIKIILPEMNNNSVPAVHILSSQDEMDIAKKPRSPEYGALDTYVARVLITNTD